MNPLAFLLIICLFLPHLQAGTPESKCFYAGSDRHFFTSEVVSDYSELGSKMPQIKCDAKGNPTDLIWVPLPEKAFADVEEIGRYLGRSIYRVRYLKPADIPDPDDPKPELICTMFAFERPQNSKGAPALSPFFIDADEDPSCIKHFSSPLTSTKEHPFALCIDKFMKGTGLYSYSWTFLFLADGAHLAERTTFGRKEGGKIYHYDMSGKIVSVQSSENGFLK
jgi:hypothetical protein